eukprot:5297628-Heterocapsa_arctica.AAC.1
MAAVVPDLAHGVKLVALVHARRSVNTVDVLVVDQVVAPAAATAAAAAGAATRRAVTPGAERRLVVCLRRVEDGLSTRVRTRV